MLRRSLAPPPFVKRRTISLEHGTIVKEVTNEPGSGVRIVRRPARAANIASSPITSSQPSERALSDSARGQVNALSNSELRPDARATEYPVQRPSIEAPPVPRGAPCTVLVIDASQKMAHEITHELSVTLPGSSILFAPTLQIALWILKRRQIDLILTNSILPDGPLTKLHEYLDTMTPPPELVVLSELFSSRTELESHPGYRFVELRRLSAQQASIEPPTHDLTRTISALGADLRNDLNNPLQEIVAMAFVAHSSQGLSPAAEQALSAIQRAATNMATVVNALEDKIRGVVAG